MPELNIAEISESLPESLKEEWYRLVSETIENNKKLLVCLLGTFSVGKSSLINMLINKDILPRALNETTTLPTFVEYCPKLEMRLTDSSGNIQHTDIETFQKAIVSKGEPGSFAALGIPESWLEEIFLVDLPGTGSTEKAKADFTKAQIKTADVIIYMIFPRGLSQDDLHLLKYIQGLGKKIIILAAQWDRVEQAGENKEQIPDLQEWEKTIHEYTGIQTSIIPSSKTGIGREKILEILSDLGRKHQEIRINRFHAMAVPLLNRAIEIFEQEKRFLNSEISEKAQSLRTEIKEKHELLLKLRKEMHSQESAARQNMKDEIEELKADITEKLKHKLEEFKTELLENPGKHEWEFFITGSNQYADQLTGEAALQFRQVYKKFGEPPVIDEEFKPLHFQFPRPRSFDSDNILYESQLKYLGDQIDSLVHEVAQGRQNLPDTIDKTKQKELTAQIQALHRDIQQIENTTVPVIQQETARSNMGRFIGRIIGEAADIGLMFIAPEMIGTKIASYVGKSSKILKIPVSASKTAEIVSKGVKALQVTHQGMLYARNKIEKTPTEHVIEKTQILEKLCLGYWGERIGGFLDPKSKTVWTPDPEFLHQKNNALIEYQVQLHNVQREFVETQREIDEKEMTQFQINSREKQLERLKNEKQELERKISIQKQEDQKKAEKQFHDSIKRMADQAVSSFIYTFDKKTYHMLNLLNETFKNYWQEEIKKAMDEHEAQLYSLEKSLKMVPDERRKKYENIAIKLNALKNQISAVKN
ncbi:Dynamin domain-containing protein [Desulfonema limicola]|uniref:Dynamin domain-containing protein n=1 Tax=Desulfonema limicola TaxID=45656 RepID=A0A975BBR1_9BACT|nr:dynamin family protein [Desulfonema limicola]QTA82442.1 Dynamin domain-containing protein [Desulfonema limicola]